VQFVIHTSLMVLRSFRSAISHETKDMSPFRRDCLAARKLSRDTDRRRRRGGSWFPVGRDSEVALPRGTSKRACRDHDLTAQKA
jgi:hypothetical protein